MASLDHVSIAALCFSAIRERRRKRIAYPWVFVVSQPCGGEPDFENQQSLLLRKTQSQDDVCMTAIDARLRCDGTLRLLSPRANVWSGARSRQKHREEGHEIQEHHNEAEQRGKIVPHTLSGDNGVSAVERHDVRSLGESSLARNNLRNRVLALS
jgi:hypothetical protein